jgi:protein SCO1/2
VGHSDGDERFESPTHRRARASARDALGGVQMEDQDGEAHSFFGAFAGKVSIVAFFYTRCTSPYKCSLTVSRLAQLQRLIRDRGLTDSVRVAAITYDPEFDSPSRLGRFARDRGVTFDDDTRFLRATAGFSELSDYFELGVNYGPSTVNRHQIELYVLDAAGEIAASFTRLQWTLEAVFAAAVDGA